MKDIADAIELAKLRNRILRSYGLQRITIQQHDVALKLHDWLAAALQSSENAEAISTVVASMPEISFNDNK